jgi:hypothetical protein
MVASKKPNVQPEIELTIAHALNVHFKDRTESYQIVLDKHKCEIKSDLSPRQLLKFFRDYCTSYQIEYKNGSMVIWPDPEERN